MYDETIIRGRIGSIDAPRWDPLEMFVPEVLCAAFMWMHAVVLADDTEIQAYKHSLTRRHLLLNHDADAWEDLDGGRYRRMRHSDALEQVLNPWWLLCHAGAGERRALVQALTAAWDRGNGDKGAGAHILPSSPACAFRRLP